MSIGYRTLSQHLNDLKKENFSLKLRIYFLEERIQHKYEDSDDAIHKSNIELKVEVESLKQELLEKQQLLDNAWADGENWKSCNEHVLLQQQKQRQEETKQDQQLLENKIQLMQEAVRLAKDETNRMSTLAEAEKENCSKLKKTIAEFTVDMTEARLLQKNYCTALAEKDRMIHQMTQLLDNKDSLITQLTEKNHKLMNHEIKDLEKVMHHLKTALQQKDDEMKNLIANKSQDAKQYNASLEHQVFKLQKTEVEVQTLQEKLQKSEDSVKVLQENLNQLTARLNIAEELAHNQECMLQSLRDNLQSRDNEVLDLYQVIDEHSNTIAKLQDMLLKYQNEHLQSFQVIPSQLELLDLQNTLFSTQMELQKKQMALRQKERQLTDAKRSQRLLEVDLLEGQQQKETTWKHNQELHGALHNLQRELHEKTQHLKKLEEENCTKVLAQEYSIQRLKQSVTQKEQMLQEYMDVLQCQEKESSQNMPASNEHMLEKLRQRIKERDSALEQAVDAKFCALEEKEKEMQQLKMIIREQEHDLERLNNVLSGNEETISTLDNLVKAKDLELEQITADYKTLQWLKQETTEKYRCSLLERESVILQLQKTLQERNKEIEEMTDCFLGKTEGGSGGMIEELKLCLQRKEKMLQDAVFARNHQAEEHMREVTELLTMISSEKMDRIVICQTCSSREQQNAGGNQSVENMTNFTHLQNLLQEKEKIIQVLTQKSVHPVSLCSNSEELNEKGEGTANTDMLNGDLAKAKEDLRLILRKMREYQLELSALQSIIMKQNEQLREQATDIDTLSRNIQIKEELIKDLQMKLVDPEDISTVELLTQQIFILKEKITSMNLVSQGQSRDTQKLFNLLEELAANISRLNETRQTETQLYNCLLQFHKESDIFNASSALHSDLLDAQALRSQLEDTLKRTMEQLVTLLSERKISACYGALCENNNAGDKTNQFKESTEDTEILRNNLQRLKSELYHLICEKKHVKEELQILKKDLSDLELYSTSDERNAHEDLCKQKFDLNMEKESGHLEQEKNKMKMEEDMDLAMNVRRQKRKRSQNDSMNCQMVEFLNEKNPLNTNITINVTKHIDYIETDMIDLANTDQLREDGEEFKIPPIQEQFSLSNAQWPVTSYLREDNKVEKQALHLQLEPQLHHIIMTSNVPTQTETNTDGNQVKHDSSEVHVDMQDLGYETCGKSENEVDETSAEFDEDEDVFIALKNTGFSQISLVESEDANVLKHSLNKQKGQQQKSQKLKWDLQRQDSSSSHVSTSTHSFTVQDEDLQSDITGVHHPKFLEKLDQRVSVLETYFHHVQKDRGTQNQIKSVNSPGKYDWLIQTQSRELSSMRQKMQEGQSVCCILTCHLKDTIKSFEEILSSYDIDYYIGQSFREQLTQGSQMAMRLNGKLRCCKENEKIEHEFQTNGVKKTVVMKDKVIDALQSTLKDRLASPTGSHASSGSHGISFMSDEQLSTNDELDDCSEVLLSRVNSPYEKGCTEDTDLRCHSSSLHLLQHSAAPDGLHTTKKEMYIIGHIDDFTTLKKNILEGKSLIDKMDTCIQSLLQMPFPVNHQSKVKNWGNIKKLIPDTKMLKNIVDESNSLLNMFWRGFQDNFPQNKQELAMHNEIHTLRNKLKEMEMLLQKASEDIKRTNLAKESMEKCIVKKLTSTCGMLKKARSTLQDRCHNKKLFCQKAK